MNTANKIASAPVDFAKHKASKSPTNFFLRILINLAGNQNTNVRAATILELGSAYNDARNAMPPTDKAVIVKLMVSSLEGTDYGIRHKSAVFLNQLQLQDDRAVVEGFVNALRKEIEKQNRFSSDLPQPVKDEDVIDSAAQQFKSILINKLGSLGMPEMAHLFSDVLMGDANR